MEKLDGEPFDLECLQRLHRRESRIQTPYTAAVTSSSTQPTVEQPHRISAIPAMVTGTIPTAHGRARCARVNWHHDVGEQLKSDTRDEALVEKETALMVEIESLLPDFARSCRGSEDVVIIHQDSFAADYQDEEYVLFGKAMKFAGIYEIRVIGRNRETLATAKAAFVQ